MLNSFMEESNIRWGEIIGGLLIIGCSTALVVVLWAQISEIPVLKFLIFTTVTAIPFGIGLYTEHCWKLPKTSRGILTIATLLVPLNFLAIAAVSAGNTTGALVIGSEIVAPAIFLCLVARALMLVPLNYSAQISIVLGVVSLFQANTWEVTWMQAQRVFWIAGILLLLLWLNRCRLLFNAFQIALIAALVLTVKATLQQYDWYHYLPHAFLHPAALQIQGTVLALLCLALLAARFVLRRALPDQNNATRGLLDTRYSVDRLLVWFLSAGFLLLAGYGSLSGVIQELGGFGSDFAGINIAGFPHQEAFGAGSWILLGLLLLVMVGTFWDRRRGIYLLGAIATLSAVVPLLAARFETQIATATAWRWWAAVFLVAGSLLLWYRDQVWVGVARLGWPALDGNAEAFVSRARNVLLALTVLPLIVLTVTPALRAIIEAPITGSSFFFSNHFSHAVPLVAAALVMIGYALRERMPELAFYAGGIFNLTLTLAFVLEVATGNGPIDKTFVVRLVQLNALTFAVYPLPWLTARQRWQSALKDSDLSLANFLLKLQVGIAVTLNTILFVTIAAELLRAPAATGIGSFLGWLTVGIIATALGWLGASRIVKLPAFALLGLLLSICCIVAFGVSGAGGWLGAHVLTVCVAMSAWLMLALSELNCDSTKPVPFPLNLLRLTFDLGGDWQTGARQCAVIAGALSVALSLRTLEDAEVTRWWSIGPVLAITILAAALNWKTLRRRYIYAAGILLSVAVSLWWVFIPPPNLFVPDFLWTSLGFNCLAGIIWLWLELRARSLRQSPSAGLAFHHLIALFSIGLLILLILSSFIAPPWHSPLRPLTVSGPAFLCVVAFMTACLWDRSAKYAVAGLYLLGPIGMAIVLDLGNVIVRIYPGSSQFCWPFIHSSGPCCGADVLLSSPLANILVYRAV